MKRGRETWEEILESLDMAKRLMFLSQSLKLSKKSPKSSATTRPSDVIYKNAFECKTCNRKFPSFQALGGHRASHKRQRVMQGHGDHQKTSTHPRISSDNNKSLSLSLLLSSTNKSKMHECSICGQGFGMGQALGGHMRRHRAAMNESMAVFPVVSNAPAVLKRSSSGRRVLCLDLNLTPLENDLDYIFGEMAPKVDTRHLIV